MKLFFFALLWVTPFTIFVAEDPYWLTGLAFVFSPSSAFIFTFVTTDGVLDAVSWPLWIGGMILAFIAGSFLGAILAMVTIGVALSDQKRICIT